MATSLANVIKFRSLASQLTKQELKVFLNKILEVDNGTTIITSLFQYFVNKDTQNDVNNTNSILRHIIESRKKEPGPLPIGHVQINDLPSEIIGYISTFMDQNMYFQFEQVNRSIFIGCNAPNMLTKLDLWSIDDYSSINLTKFQSLKVLEMDITKFDEFVLPNHGEIIPPHLNDLTLEAGNKTDFDIESFINCTNTTNVKSLRLCQFGGVEINDDFSVDHFYRILTKFINIEFLRLFEVFLPDISNICTKLSELCPNLKGLSVNGGNSSTVTHLVNTFGNNLQFYLHSLVQVPLVAIDYNNINFSKLQQLIFFRGNMKQITDILKSATNIEQILLWPFCEITDNMSLSQQEIKDIIPQIFKCKALNYFEIEVNKKSFEAVMYGIEKGLRESRKWEREQFKIKIVVHKNAQINTKEMILNIGRIIDQLQLSNINHFMFILDINEIENKYGKELNAKVISNDLNNMSSSIQATAYGLLFVVENKNCKINGFEQRWLYDY